jgi:hypothetical protein
MLIPLIVPEEGPVNPPAAVTKFVAEKDRPVNPADVAIDPLVFIFPVRAKTVPLNVRLGLGFT